jgi:hypothetical protein
VPVVPACLLEPLWDQFAPLLPFHPAVAPTHPLGCHRRRIPDRVVFEHVVAALVHGEVPRWAGRRRYGSRCRRPAAPQLRDLRQDHVARHPLERPSHRDRVRIRTGRTRTAV